MTQKVKVALGARSYEVEIGRGLLAQLARRLSSLGNYSAWYILADENLRALHGEQLFALKAHWIDIPAGEGSKSFAELERLLETLLSYQPDRHVGLLAFGGGVVGDLVGLTASLLLRGVDFVQVPTTLLAMVDSSVGGKTAINSRVGKNLIGSFYQPRLVMADLDCLTTLPARELHAGYAEVAKYGALGDAKFFSWLEASAVAALAGDTELLEYMVAHCVRMKAAIVGADEREQGKRALLNLGHTMGHAFEAETGFGSTLLHGEAVALGMAFAFRLAVALNRCPMEDAMRLEHHLAQLGLPIHPHQIRPEWDQAALIRHCHGDKKAAHGQLTFVLPSRLGECDVVRPVAPEMVAACLDDWLSQ